MKERVIDVLQKKRAPILNKIHVQGVPILSYTTFLGPTNSIISLNTCSAASICIIKACRKIIWCRHNWNYISRLYTHSQEYFSNMYTPRTARLCENLFAWDIRHAFSILERECNVGSFDLANEPTFKLSGTQMVMIIIIIWSSVSSVLASSRARASVPAYQYTHIHTHLMNSRVRHTWLRKADDSQGRLWTIRAWME